MITSRPWVDDPLEFLVRCRFPLERPYRASNGVRASPTAADRSAYLKDAADYRAALQKKPLAELRVLAEAASKDEAEKALAKAQVDEAGRFFNQPNADTDIEHWARMSLWTLDEAVALSLGKDPRRVNWENVRALIQISSFAATYKARHEILTRAKLAGQLWESMIPGVFIAWAGRMRVSVHAPLVEAIKGLGVQVADWKSAYDVQRKIAEDATAELLIEKKEGMRKTTEHTANLKKMADDYGELINSYRTRIAALEGAARQQVASTPPAVEPIVATTQKPLGVRERESLLKLVIGMAVEAYRYDPHASRSDVISEIAGDLQKAGVPLDVDTVRKYLREARELMPPAETEQKG